MENNESDILEKIVKIIIKLNEKATWQERNILIELMSKIQKLAQK